MAVLGTLTVVALVESLFGLIGPQPLELLVTAVVLVVAVQLSGTLLGLAFRVRPHRESGIVTAQLLLFAVQPSLELWGLVGIAVVGVVASASKFLLAWRGRHLFNPAAVALLLVSLVGLVVPTWWVGTPALLPFVAVGALIVLFRVRHLGIAAVYLAVALAVGLVTFLQFGAGVPDAVAFILGSSPVVFVAGFMVVEPLTLAPRRWQQFGIAAIVAVVASVPWSLGPLSAGPELALTLGSLLGVIAGWRAGIRLRFLGARALTPTSVELRFRPERPLHFRGGQFLELDLPHAHPDARGRRRVFSIASDPAADELAIALRVPERPSSFKRAIGALEPGDRLAATQLGGEFVLPGGDRRMLLVASGIGITPFVAQLAELSRAGRLAEVELIWAVSSAGDLPYRDEIAATGIDVAVVGADPGTLPPGWRHLGDGPLTPELLRAAVPELHERVVELSGPPVQIAQLERALHRAGVRHVRTDAFIGY